MWSVPKLSKKSIVLLQEPLDTEGGGPLPSNVGKSVAENISPCVIVIRCNIVISLF
jgi:hypothetical protein